MSPPDKLEFLETFAFKDVNLPEIKNKSKKICISRNEELNKTISQLPDLPAAGKCTPRDSNQHIDETTHITNRNGALGNYRGLR